MNEIFEQLAAAAIAIPLLSKAYFDSGNCRHEAQKIVEGYDSKALRMIPVKLSSEKLDAPAWLTTVQYERAFSLDGDPDGLAQRIVDLVKQKQNA